MTFCVLYEVKFLKTITHFAVGGWLRNKEGRYELNGSGKNI